MDLCHRFLVSVRFVSPRPNRPWLGDSRIVSFVSPSSGDTIRVYPPGYVWWIYLILLVYYYYTYYYILLVYYLWYYLVRGMFLHMSDINSGDGCWYVRTFGVNRTDELILFDYGLSELCHRRFQEESYYDGVITGIEGGRGRNRLFFVVKTLSPSTPVTQYMRWHNSPRGVKPLVRGGLIVSPIVSQTPICVTAFWWHNSLWTDSTVTGPRVQIVSPIVSPGVVTQFRGVSGVPSNCVTNCVTALVTQFRVYSGSSQGISGLRSVNVFVTQVFLLA